MSKSSFFFICIATPLLLVTQQAEGSGPYEDLAYGLLPEARCGYMGSLDSDGDYWMLGLSGWFGIADQNEGMLSVNSFGSTDPSAQVSNVTRIGIDTMMIWRISGDGFYERMRFQPPSIRLGALVVTCDGDSEADLCVSTEWYGPLLVFGGKPHPTKFLEYIWEFWATFQVKAWLVPYNLSRHGASLGCIFAYGLGLSIEVNYMYEALDPVILHGIGVWLKLNVANFIFLATWING